MTFLQKDVGNDAATVDRERNLPTYRPASSDSYVGDRFWLHTDQNLFHQLQVRCKISSDLKANSITISGCPSNREGLLQVRMREVSGSNENDRRLLSCTPVDLRHWITDPKLITDQRRFGYSGFKRKVSFFGLDSRSMPNPGGIQIFHPASGAAARAATVKKT
jgi:hypothetical protein